MEKLLNWQNVPIPTADSSRYLGLHIDPKIHVEKTYQNQKSRAQC